MDKEVKILHIIDSLGLGGAQTVVKGIFEFQKNNKNIFLFALRNRDILMKVNHANVQIFNSSKKYSFGPLFALRDLIKREKITILHCHLFKSQIFGFLLKKIWFRNIKLIFHEHGEIFENHITYILFMRASRSTINKIIAVSNATKENLTAKAGIKENKIQVLYNFVDLNKYNKKNITWSIEEERKKLGIGKDELVIGFVGRLAKVKGCEYLIRSLPYLYFPYKVIIAGNGSEKNNLNELAKSLKVDNRIIFLGYREDVVYIYHLLDVLVVPSIFESFGLSIVEAQCMFIPVIATDAIALNELIKNKENGLLFELKNPIDLSEKIKLLYRDKELRSKLVKSGLESVKKFDLEDYIYNINKLYEDIGLYKTQPDATR